MNKFISILIILIVCFSVFGAPFTSEPFAHYMLGYVESATDFSVEIFEEVLPFDLDGSEVAYNPNWATLIRGLRIGQYSLISNTGDFELYISHTKLTLRGAARAGDEGTLSEIDYRLYAIADYNNTRFLSCLSDAGASSADSCTNVIRVAGDNPNVWPDGATMCSIVNQSLYVSLDEDTNGGSTVEAIANLKGGTYESTIYLLLKGL